MGRMKDVAIIIEEYAAYEHHIQHVFSEGTDDQLRTLVRDLHDTLGDVIKTWVGKEMFDGYMKQLAKEALYEPVPEVSVLL